MNIKKFLITPNGYMLTFDNTEKLLAQSYRDLAKLEKENEELRGKLSNYEKTEIPFSIYLIYFDPIGEESRVFFSGDLAGLVDYIGQEEINSIQLLDEEEFSNFFLDLYPNENPRQLIEDYANDWCECEDHIEVARITCDE